MKIYLPFYNTQNLYLPLDPITTNLPYYKALHSSVSAIDLKQISCETLVSVMPYNFTVFTSKENVIRDSTSLADFYCKEGCVYAEQVSENIFILFAGEAGAALNHNMDV